MELFGIGPLELLFIILLALIIFGPKDLQKTSRTLGRSLNKLVNSDTWRAFTQVSRKIRTLPNTLMREARLEDLGLKEAGQSQAGTIKAAPPDGLVILPPAGTPDNGTQSGDVKPGGNENA